MPRYGQSDDESNGDGASTARNRQRAFLRADTPVTEGTAALATRLNMVPTALLRVAGEDGEVPAAVVSRLERAAETGEGVATRLGLGENRGDVFRNLFTEQSLAVIDAENQGGGSIDPERLESITRETVDNIRGLAGDEAAEAAERELAKLR